jgi:hypothetical protein
LVPLERLAEPHRPAAIARGALSGVPGERLPRPHADRSMVPEDRRAGDRWLQPAGDLPPEREALREIRDAEARVARIRDPEERDRPRRCLRLLARRFQERRGQGLGQVVQPPYQDTLHGAFAPDQDATPD